MNHSTMSPPDTDYAAFLAGKRIVAEAAGFDVAADALNPHLFPFQRDLVRWALRKGRCALFATTGMGKTPMQLAWAERVHCHTGQDVLILAPLAVAQQTVREGQKFGISVTLCRDKADVRRGVNVANYERLHRFEPARFGAVVLDESSILKAFSGVTKRALVDTFADTPLRLCCTATPAPNDVIELTNHAEFLGIMPQQEMISTFFISKGHGETAGQYRLKSHARRAFFRWLASWAMSLNKPSDLGYADDGFDLPPLSIHLRSVSTDWVPEGHLLPGELKGVTDRAGVRRATIADRVASAVDLVRSEPDEAWLVWCGLNEEGRAVGRKLPGSVIVEGCQSPEEKADALLRFADGSTRILITKPTIAGFGLNLQRCSRMVFLGLSDSFESYFQCIRRCWRFGQTRPVAAHIVLSELETAIYNNVLRKEAAAADMSRELIGNVAEYERAEVRSGELDREGYEPAKSLSLPSWMRRRAHA